MANDTSVTRVAQDSNLPVQRKKSNAESFDLRQLSFFDELLGLGQFDSTLPEPINLPSSPDFEDNYSGYDEAPGSDKIESNDDADDVQVEPTAVEHYAVVSPSQQSLFVVDEKSDSAIDARPEQEVVKDKTVPGPLVSNSAEAQKSGQANSDNNYLIGSAEGVENGKPATDAQIADQQNNLQPVDDKLALENAASEEALRSNKKSASANGSIQESQRPTNEPEPSARDSNLDHVRGTLKQSRQPTQSQDVSPVSNLREVTSEPTKLDASAIQPRNKRAERLAKQATEPELNTKGGDISSEPNQILDFTNESTSNERALDDRSISASDSPTTSSPVVSIPPMVAAAFTLTQVGSSSIGILAASVDGSSTVATPSVPGSALTSNSSTTISSNGTSTARADQSRTEAVRYSAGTHITAHQEAKLVQRVLRGVEQLANGGGQVRLRLHPPELGSLQMSLRMEAGQVFAKLEVENTTARDALLNNVQTLKDRMAEQGMKVAAFEVEVSTDSSGSGTANSNTQSEGKSGRDSRWDHATSRFAQQNNNRLSSEPTHPDRELRAKWIRTNGSLDLTV